MNIMIVGGDTRQLDHIENQISQFHNDALVFKTTALNNAILQTQMTAFDLVISSLQMSHEDGLRLSNIFQSEDYNAHTPVVSIYEIEEESDWLDSVLPETLTSSYFASSVEELLQIAEDLLKPERYAQVA